MPENHRAEEAAGERRRRYTPQLEEQSLVALTPAKVAMLRFLAELRFLSLPQLAKLVCPCERQELSEKRARRHLRALFDAGLVDVLSVSRLALAPLDAPNDATLLYGSAPNIYVPMARGLEVLHQAGLIDKALLKRPPAAYGPKNSLFLAHELQVRDVRVWLEGCAQVSHGQQRVLTWKDGQDAAIELPQGQTVRWVKPDAWFVFQVREGEGQCKNPVVLVGLVEVDRGTERGNLRWQEKLEAYEFIFASGRLREVTGYVNARVLVFCPDARRREGLAELITQHASASLQPRVWLVERGGLAQDGLTQSAWQQPGSKLLRPLVPAGLSQECLGEMQ